VVVDRTPPTFYTAFPQDTVAFNDWTFGVSFSEPILASSLPGTQLRYSDTLGGYVPAYVTLSESGQTLTATLTDYSVWGHEQTRYALFHPEALTDLAGNPLVMPNIGDYTWSWQALAYKHHPLDGAPSGRVAMAVGASGAPVIAFASTGTEGGRVHVRRWTEAGGSDIGGPLVVGTPTATTTMGDPLVQVGPDGQPVVAFLQRDSADARSALHVFRWDSAQWQPVGARVDSPEDGEVLGAALVLDLEGRPVVAWSTPQGIHVTRWETDQWRAVGEPLPSHAAALAPALAVDPKGRVIVVWVGAVDAQSETGLFVRRWEGGGWTPVKKGEPIHEYSFPDRTFEAPAVAVDAKGEPLVVWAEHHTYSDGDAVAWVSYARTLSHWEAWATSSLGHSEHGVWEEPLALAPAVAVSAYGSEWMSWGGSELKIQDVSVYGLSVTVVDDHRVGSAALVVDSKGQPMLAWTSRGGIKVGWR
jgi:hypothetical protein